MAERANQLEPRSARCLPHGRIYDRRTAIGCPACLVDASPRPRPPESRRTGSALLLLLLLGVAFLCLPDGFVVLTAREAPSDGHDGEDVARNETASRRAAAGTIDPGAYRDLIESLEAVLYRPETPEFDAPETVGALAMRLGERLYADLGPLAGKRALVDLALFGSEIESSTDAGYATPSLDGPRARWEELRRALFRPAPWFRRTDAALVVAQQPVPHRVAILDLLALRSFADEIDAMLQGARDGLMRFGEPGVDVAEASREERELVRRFRFFAEEWDARVRLLQGRMPHAPPLDGDLHAVGAHQALGQALHQLSLATTSVGDAAVPMKWWRGQCLDAAAARIAEARKEMKLVRQTTARADAEHAR